MNNSSNEHNFKIKIYVFYIMLDFSMDKIFSQFSICCIFFKNKSNNNIQQKDLHRCFNEDTALGITFCTRARYLQ